MLSPAMWSVAHAADGNRAGHSHEEPHMSRHTVPARLMAAGVAIAMVPALAGLSAAGASTAAAAALRSSASPPLSPSDQLVHDKLTTRSLRKALGSDLAGLVTDAATGQVLWSQHAGAHQLPASNAKLVTAVNALSVFGPTYTITTKVVQGKKKRRVVLVGAGDPSLTKPSLNRLAKAVAATYKARGLRWARVRVDDSLFPAPSLAHGWKANYVHADVRAVRALVVDQHDVSDTALDAGNVFAKRLAKNGLPVRSVKRQTAPARAPVLATTHGASMASMVGTMLRNSDNDYAEALHRLVAIKTGHAPTWTGAQQAQRRTLSGVGVSLSAASVLYDGSGLSRDDRLTPTDVVRVLAVAFDGHHPALVSLQHNSLAIAGVSGTLAPRYLRYVTAPTKCAAGLIEAKTGSLSGVIALSGFARGADGRTKLFSFLLNGVPSTLKTRLAVDRLATTITGCW
jgi:D-alanyl-D-alanine carboxypeptidase/D-alanyl-D-alanine-endopeptidase (penicillin-binding protein 4)